MLRDIKMVEEKISKSIEFCKSFEGHRSALYHQFPDVVANAKDALQTLDFPTTRSEEWKYTRTTRISNEAWNISNVPSSIDIQPSLIPDLNAHCIVFVNGFFRQDLSSPSFEEGVKISQTLRANLLPDAVNVFQTIHTAYCTDVISIGIEKNVQLKNPIHILHFNDVALGCAMPLVEVIAEVGCQVHFVESFISTIEEKTFSHRQLLLNVHENAIVHFDKIQSQSDNHFLLNDEQVSVASNGNFTVNTITIDGGWVRNNLHISLDGQNIEANLNGVFFPRNKQLVDNHTKVDHRFPHCNSNELYKGLMDDQGSGVFNGKVFVHPDAQKTNAFQSNANILLSDDAQMNTKPELEIYADDVKCSHGTTTGQLDESALFYLKARGIGEENARKLLATAFINDVLLKISNNAVRDFVTKELVDRSLIFI